MTHGTPSEVKPSNIDHWPDSHRQVCTRAQTQIRDTDPDIADGDGEVTPVCDMSQSGKGRIVSSSNVSGFACSCGESFRRSAELERHQNNCPFYDGPETRQSNTRGADRRRRHVQPRNVNAMGGGCAGGGGAGGGAGYAPSSAADVFHTAGSTGGSAGGSAGGGGRADGGAGDAPGSAADVFHAAGSTGSISPEGIV